MFTEQMCIECLWCEGTILDDGETEMNKADNDAGNAAIDSLLNYETVKVIRLI